MYEVHEKYYKNELRNIRVKQMERYAWFLDEKTLLLRC